jgi:hypothetical protein
MKKIKLFIGYGYINKKELSIFDLIIINCKTQKIVFHKTINISTETELEKIDFDIDSIIAERLKVFLKTFNSFWIFKNSDLGRKFSWVEMSIEEVYIEDKGFNTRYFYIGGNYLLNNKCFLTFPIGVVGNDINKMIENLALKINYLIKTLPNEYSVTSSRVWLNAYSSGLLIHEILGHTSEIDVFKECCKLSKNIYNNLDIYDIPNDNCLIDYEYDDNLTKGIIINLKNDFLANNTGNTFLGVDSNNNLYSLIRQRNILIRPIKCVTSSYDCYNKLFIMKAGISTTSKKVNIIGLVNCNKVLSLQFPLNDIKRIEPASDKSFNFGCICHKMRVPHYFSISSIETILDLEQPIQDYIEKEVNL